MPREFRRCAALAVALACPGCSLILDFSDSAAPKDAAIDGPYTAAECAYMEPNDTPAEAMMITPGVDMGPAAICAGPTVDEDWYKFAVPMGATNVTVAIMFVNALGDLDLQVFSAADTQNPVGQSRGFSDGETVTCPGASPPCPMLAAGTYLFRVYPGTPDQLNNYTFNVTIH
jgi:hypothetical protein